LHRMRPRSEPAAPSRLSDGYTRVLQGCGSSAPVKPQYPAHLQGLQSNTQQPHYAHPPPQQQWQAPRNCGQCGWTLPFPPPNFCTQCSGMGAPFLPVYCDRRCSIAARACKCCLSSAPIPKGPQPQYGQPQYGQPQYGQPQYGGQVSRVSSYAVPWSSSQERSFLEGRFVSSLEF
jgi:hypothetical protein